MVSTPRDSPLTLGIPRLEEGAAVWQLIRRCPPLDVNTCYAYLLLCRDFAATSVVARRGTAVVGYLSAYRRPDRPEALFVWQVAVDASARGEGLAGRMIDALLARPACEGVRWLETTIAPDNAPSQGLFKAFAQRRGVACATEPLFSAAMFDGEAHEDEILYRIGPLV